MKALTLHQPWASAIAWRLKYHETRSWSTKYRGPIAIHAAKSIPKYAREFMQEDRYKQILGDNHLLDIHHTGCVVAVANLVGIYTTEYMRNLTDPVDFYLGDWGDGRCAWRLDDIKLLEEPVYVSGKQGLWNVDLSLDTKEAAQ